MPLIILGLLLIVGIAVYSLIRYGQSEETDTRSVRERYPHIFERIDETVDRVKRNASYTVIEDDDEESSGENTAHCSEDGHTIHFPDNAEVEKRKRNINTDT